MDKKIIFVSFIFLIGIVSSLSLTMSPPITEFRGNFGDKVCHDILIKTTGEIDGQVLFCPVNTSIRNIKTCNASSEKEGYEIDFPQNIFVENNKTISVCIKLRESDDRYALLLYKLKDRPAQVGVWLKMNMDGTAAIAITGNMFRTVAAIDAFMWVPIGLFGTLVILLWIYKRKKKSLEFEKEKIVDELI